MASRTNVLKETAQRFPTTQWSIIEAAQGVQTPDARQALERLFETYWFPVYAFMRSRVSHAADAEDLTQGLFASLLEHCSLDTVKPESGRFRAFLLASAKHYIMGEQARLRCQKRGGGRPALSLDFAAADQRYRLEAAPQDTPEAQFERQWALAAFEAAQERMRAAFAREGNAIQFEAFRAFLAPGEQPPTYAEVAAALEMTETAVKVAVHRARRRFARLLHYEIAQTVTPGVTQSGKTAIDEEIRYLIRLLGR